MSNFTKSLLALALVSITFLLFTSCAAISENSTKGEKNMTEVLTIVARIEAKKDKIDFVKSEALKLLEPTRNEKGCILYNLHQDNESPEIFIFVEYWESQNLLQLHLESSHLKTFVEVTDGSLVDLTINKMSKID